MCLAIPALIKNIDNGIATVDIGGVQKQTSLMLTPQATVGDYVLLHAGYAVSIVNTAEAEASLSLFEELARRQAEAAGG